MSRNNQSLSLEGVILGVDISKLVNIGDIKV